MQDSGPKEVAFWIALTLARDGLQCPMPNPYPEDSRERAAWDEGLAAGRRRAWQERQAGA